MSAARGAASPSSKGFRRAEAMPLYTPRAQPGSTRRVHGEHSHAGAASNAHVATERRVRRLGPVGPTTPRKIRIRLRRARLPRAPRARAACVPVVMPLVLHWKGTLGLNQSESEILPSEPCTF
jgi:hypothetical protein